MSEVGFLFAVSLAYVIFGVLVIRLTSETRLYRLLAKRRRPPRA